MIVSSFLSPGESQGSKVSQVPLPLAYPVSPKGFNTKIISLTLTTLELTLKNSLQKPEDGNSNQVSARLDNKDSFT